jgi:hypothetical protein
MSWLYSQALVEEYLGDISLDGEQSVQSSGNPTQQAYCAPDKMTDFSRLSQFGMTYKPLTENLGKELLTLYQEAFLAKTSQQLEKEQELMENDQECGKKWRGSFVKFDQNSSSWKTHQCSLLGDLEKFSETWPQWGLMRDGECWEHPMSEQTIKEKEFGLSEEIWPTPDANCGQRGTQPNWTPKRKSGHSAQYTINQAVRDRQIWPTPQASDNRDRGNLSSPVVQRRIKIGKQIMLSQSVDQNSGQLNPTWVEWLMGWPLGWTDLKPLETDKSLCVQQQHGEY